MAKKVKKKFIPGPKRHGRGKMFSGKMHSPENIARILNTLMNTPHDLDQWHTPQGKKINRDSWFRVKLTFEQHSVFSYLCREVWKTTKVDFIRKMIIREYFKQSGYMEHIAQKVTPRTMKILFDYAYQRAIVKRKLRKHETEV